MKMAWVYWAGWVVFGSMARSVFGARVKGRENLVTSGAVLVVSNHESFIDPPLVGSVYSDDMYFLARKTLFKGIGKWLYPRWNAIPVDQERPDMASLKTIIRLLKNGKRVLVFPEGQRTLDGSLGEAQPGVGLIAVKAGVPIQPMRIRGAREALPRGRSLIRFNQLELSIGPAFTLTDHEVAQSKGKAGYQLLADRMMESIAQL